MKASRENLKVRLEKRNAEVAELKQRLKKRRDKSTYLARRCILDEMPAESVCAEIGVYEGEFSRFILDHGNTTWDRSRKGSIDDFSRN